MNNQKDTQKTNINSYGQDSVLDVKSFTDKPIYEFANKKTEKLVTALYMVTDCMDTDDALKSKLRQLGVELLSDMYKLSNLSPMDRHVHISSSLARADEILSFVEIAYTIGFISEMNTLILKKEFLILIGELESHQKKDKHFTFTLDEKMFSLPVDENDSQYNKSINEPNYIKDKKVNTNNNMSFINSETNLSLNNKMIGSIRSASVSDKKDRVDKILALLQGRNVSIKDISNSFSNCSEKTIQRELNSLVSKGQIKKTGLKRWSRYQLIVNSI